MKEDHCLVCYSSPGIPLQNDPKPDLKELYKILRLPIDPFQVIFKSYPFCPGCRKNILLGSQLLKELDKIQEELSQLKSNITSQLRSGHELSCLNLDKGPPGDSLHEKRSSILHQLHLEEPEDTRYFSDEPKDIKNDISLLPVEPFFAGSPALHQEYSSESLADENPDPVQLEAPTNSIRVPKKSNLPVIKLKNLLIKLERLPIPSNQERFNINQEPLASILKIDSKPSKPCFRICKTCGLSCNRYQYINHSKIYDKDRGVYICCCSSEFPTLEEIKKHRNGHRGLRLGQTRSKKPPPSILDLTCEECTKLGRNKTFNKEYKLRAHIKTVHSLEKRFKCSYEGCSKAYQENSNLNKHVKSFHLKLRPYLCDTCPSSFFKKAEFERHCLGHRPKNDAFQCPHCSFSTYHSTYLTIHIKRQHTDAPRHLCNICGLTYKHKDYLREHMDTHKVKGDKFRPKSRSCWKKNPENIP